jgi:hypothetical protein
MAAASTKQQQHVLVLVPQDAEASEPIPFMTEEEVLKLRLPSASDGGD